MSHSEEVRMLAVKYVEEGGSLKEASRLFAASRASIQRWRIRKEQTGSVQGKPRKKGPYKIDNEALRNYVKEKPDAYLREIALHFKVTIACISIALKRLNITRKKSPSFTKKKTH